MPIEKELYVFDIDETLLASRDRRVAALKEYRVRSDIPKHHTAINPYTGTPGDCCTLFRSDMTEIMKGILENGDEIAFLTSGSLEAEEMKLFFSREYGITLPESTQCINMTDPMFDPFDSNGPSQWKAGRLEYLQKKHGILGPQKVIFVDNDQNNIDAAREKRFTTFHAQTSDLDLSPNRDKWVTDLRAHVSSRSQNLDVKKYRRQSFAATRIIEINLQKLQRYKVHLEQKYGTNPPQKVQKKSRLLITFVRKVMHGLKNIPAVTIQHSKGFMENSKKT